MSGNNMAPPPMGDLTSRDMVALGYVRRSKESGARTVSLEDQQERIAAYCQERGWQLAEILADDGVSGGRRERLDRYFSIETVVGKPIVSLERRLGWPVQATQSGGGQ